MPLTGEYVPSTWDWVADQVATYSAPAAGGEHPHGHRHPDHRRDVDGRRLRQAAQVRADARRARGRVRLIASKGGDPAHPAWYHNLVAEPLVEIQDGATPHDYRTEIVTGDERQAWWDRGVAVYPPDAEYQEKTDREIPVFVARRVD